MTTEDTKALGARKTRELNQARSKPVTVDWPVRSACTFVHHYNSTQDCNIETVFLNIPLPLDQHHISDGGSSQEFVCHVRPLYN